MNINRKTKCARVINLYTCATKNIYKLFNNVFVLQDLWAN